MEPEHFRRPVSAVQVASSLANEGIIDPMLVGVIREVYSVASPAIHGGPVRRPRSASSVTLRLGFSLRSLRSSK